jgi:hypothetical protein
MYVYFVPTANFVIVTFKHDGSPGQAADALVSGNSSWVRATPLSGEANEYSPNCLNVASQAAEPVLDDPEKVSEVLLTLSSAKKGLADK